MGRDTDVARVAAALRSPALRYRSFGNEPIRAPRAPREVEDAVPLLGAALTAADSAGEGRPAHLSAWAEPESAQWNELPPASADAPSPAWTGPTPPDPAPWAEPPALSSWMAPSPSPPVEHWAEAVRAVVPGWSEPKAQGAEPAPPAPVEPEPVASATRPEAVLESVAAPVAAARPAEPSRERTPPVATPPPAMPIRPVVATPTALSLPVAAPKDAQPAPGAPPPSASFPLLAVLQAAGGADGQAVPSGATGIPAPEPGPSPVPRSAKAPVPEASASAPAWSRALAMSRTVPPPAVPTLLPAAEITAPLPELFRLLAAGAAVPAEAFAALRSSPRPDRGH